MGSYIDRDDLEDMGSRMDRKVIIIATLAYSIFATFYFLNKVF